MLFVVMPWHSIQYPSLGMGILTSLANKYRPKMKTKTIYASLMFAEYLQEVSEGKFGPDKYQVLGEDYFFKATGEWVFSSALRELPEWNVERYKAYFKDDEVFSYVEIAHRAANDFIEKLANEILSLNPDYVALTSVFQQNVPCLALAKRLKKKRPEITIMMGGGNCDGIQGVTLHKSFEFLDFVFRGEGEIPFKSFLSYLDGKTELGDIPSLCWRDESGEPIVNKMGQLTPASEYVIPEYQEYFDGIATSTISKDIEPNIITESSRGCWWGQKHHCTFCGLNGTGMEFRSKSPDKFISELKYLLEKHKILDVILSDNIMDMGYLKTVLPEIAKLDWDVRLHYEIKSNIRREQLEVMRDAGVWHIQPGIESFSTNVLKIMRKGATGAQNIKLLMDCEELNLTTSWNILMGFPEETIEDYVEIRNQLKAMVHLQPPAGATRIAIERFSPYFDNKSLGFNDHKPASCYSIIYDLPQDVLHEMVYVFDVTSQGVSNDVIDDMDQGVQDWIDAYERGSTLTKRERADGIMIFDRRLGWEFRDILINDPLDLAIYKLIERPMKLDSIISALNHDSDISVNKVRVSERLDRLKKDGLLFEENASFVALATNEIPFRFRLTG